MGAVAPALVGVAFAGFAAAFLRLTGMERDRAAAPVILIAVATFWPVFAVEEGGAAEIALHGAVASSFLALALVAHRVASALAGAGLIAHGVFDASAALLSDAPGPPWWAPFCSAFDGVLGGYLLVRRPAP